MIELQFHRSNPQELGSDQIPQSVDLSLKNLPTTLTLPSTEEINSSPIDELITTIRANFQVLNRVVAANTALIPPLAFHGANDDGFRELQVTKRFNCGRGDGVGFVTSVAVQAVDPTTLAHDLVNAAIVAGDYGSHGVLIFRGEKLGIIPDESGVISYRSLSDCDGTSEWYLASTVKHNKLNPVTGYQRLAGGLYAEECQVSLKSDKYDEALLGQVEWSKTELPTPQTFVGSDRDRMLRRQIYSEIRGLLIVATALSSLQDQDKRTYEPRQPLEEREPSIFKQKNLEDGTIQYTWGDDREVRVSRALVFQPSIVNQPGKVLRIES